jgi:hypothetical protein
VQRRRRRQARRRFCAERSSGFTLLLYSSGGETYVLVTVERATRIKIARDEKEIYAVRFPLQH